MPGINQKAVLSYVHLYLIQTDQVFNLQNAIKLDGGKARLKNCKLSQLTSF